MSKPVGLESAFADISLAIDGDAGASETIKNAQKLLQEKVEADNDFVAQTSNLPLLEPGQQLKQDEVGLGFRVKIGYKVSFSSKGGCKVSEDKDSNCDDDTTVLTFVTRFPHGLAWVYWTDEKFDKYSLGECAIKFGLGGYAKNGLQSKVIFLDESRTFGNCFLLALTKNGIHILSRTSEENTGIYRLFRSAVPQNIKDTICLRELISVRQCIAEPRFWYM